MRGILCSCSSPNAAAHGMERKVKVGGRAMLVRCAVCAFAPGARRAGGSDFCVAVSVAQPNARKGPYCACDCGLPCAILDVCRRSSACGCWWGCAGARRVSPVCGVGPRSGSPLGLELGLGVSLLRRRSVRGLGRARRCALKSTERQSRVARRRVDLEQCQWPVRSGARRAFAFAVSRP